MPKKRSTGAFRRFQGVSEADGEGGLLRRWRFPPLPVSLSLNHLPHQGEGETPNELPEPRQRDPGPTGALQRSRPRLIANASRPGVHVGRQMNRIITRSQRRLGPQNLERKISMKSRKARALFSLSASDYIDGESDEFDKVDGWINGLTSDAEFNITSYTDCFYPKI